MVLKVIIFGLTPASHTRQLYVHFVCLLVKGVKGLYQINTNDIF